MARQIIRSARTEYPCSKGCGHVIQVGEKHRDIDSGGMRVCLDCNNKPAHIPIALRTTRRDDLPETSVLAARRRDGVSLRQLGAELNFSPSGLRLRLRTAGFTTAGEFREVSEPIVSPLQAALRSWSEPWMSEGICAQTDPDAFYPEKGGSTREAKRVCLGCPVREMCLRYALEHGERFGIWGGTSERERRKLAKDREVAA